MKIIVILDQIQAGLGGKEKGMQPLGGKKLPVGSAKMFENYLSEVDGSILATLYCGDDFYLANPEETALKLTAMVKKLKPDVVLCGPCFNYEKYGIMAGDVALMIQQKLQIPTVAAMSVECVEGIEKHKEDVTIVKMPKKGGIGLTESIQKMLQLCQLKTTQADISEFVEQYCY